MGVKNDQIANLPGIGGGGVIPVYSTDPPLTAPGPHVVAVDLVHTIDGTGAGTVTMPPGAVLGDHAGVLEVAGGSTPWTIQHGAEALFMQNPVGGAPAASVPTRGVAGDYILWSLQLVPGLGLGWMLNSVTPVAS